MPESLPYIPEVLKNVKDQTVIISGLWSKSAEPPEGTTGSDHWVAAAFLTAIKPRKTAGSDASVGSNTIDQLIADQIGQENLLPSLQLAVEDPNSSSSNCGEGYSCSYTNSISWRGDEEMLLGKMEKVEGVVPLPMELDPQVVFERLFGSGATPEVRAQRMRQSRSILDSLLAELQGLKKNLGVSDQELSISTPRRFERSSAASSWRRKPPVPYPKFRSHQVFRSCSTTTSGCTGI